MNLQLRDFAIRDLGCTACFLHGIGYPVACEKHHLNEGDQPGRKRLGEHETVGLCQWHHVGRCLCTNTGVIRNCSVCKERHGPSWRWHKREFLDTYGDGESFLVVQNDRINKWRGSTV